MKSAKHPLGRLLSILMALALLTAVVPAAMAAEPDPTTTFTFTDEGITASGGEEGYSISGTDLTINAAGIYLITGSCADGSISVKKEVTGVTLMLKNLTLSSSVTAPLAAKKSTETTLWISGNVTLTNREDPTDEETNEDFEGAAIKVKSGGKMTITGTGTLTADGSACKNAIKGGATAEITIEDGVTVIAKAANNGIASDGSLTINGGNITVTAEGDGIKADPDEDDTESTGTLTINGGNINITAGDDGIASKGEMNITGGTFTLNTTGDAVNGDSDVNITGGVFNITAGDDALHSEYVLTLGTEGAESGPDITVTTCNEGFEGAAVFLHSGRGVAYCIDDGVNAANGDLTGYSYHITITGGYWYINADGDGIDSNGAVNISGGETIVYGSVGGENSAFDFDGQCAYTGGTIIAIGNGSMMQTPNSGTYVLFGRGGFGGFPGGGQPGDQPGGQPGDQPGGQPGGPGGDRPGGPGGDFPGGDFPGGDFSGGDFPGGQPGGDQSAFTINKGDVITIKDSEGNTLYTATGEKTADSVLFASEALVSGETYTLYINGEQVASATAGEGSANPGGPGGEFPGGPGGPGMPDDSRGDINGDGEISNVDLVALARYIVNLEQFTDEQKTVADIIPDGTIDNMDLVALAMRLVRA